MEINLQIYDCILKDIKDNERKRIFICHKSKKRFSELCNDKW
jgi:hypothetical protein